MQSIIVYPRACITAIFNIMDQLDPDDYEAFLNEEPLDNTKQRFFQARQSVISWIVYKDGFRYKEIECMPQLINKLNIIQQAHEHYCGKPSELYKIVTLENTVA